MDSSRKRKWFSGPARSAGRKTRRVLQFNSTQRNQLPAQWQRVLRYNRRPGGCTPPIQHMSDVHAIEDIGDGGVVVCINNCPAGNIVGTRHTQKVRWSRLLLKGNVTLGSEGNAHNIYQWIYMWLVYDRRPGNVNPRIIRLFSGQQNNPETWMKNQDNADRFVVCMEKRYSLIGHGYSDTAMVTDRSPNFAYMRSRPISVNKKLTGTTLFKDTTDGGVGDMDRGAYYLVFSTFQSYHVNVTLNKRMWFKSV
nr:coat protein [Fraxinus symptomless virus]